MFTVTLHHLSQDLKKAGVEFPDGELSQVTDKRLREMIAALASIGSRETRPATPELRIVAPHGRFVIQVGEGRLRFHSWSVRVGGADLTADQIFAIVTGTEDPVVAAQAADSFLKEGKRSNRRKLVLFAILILGTNATTAWMLLRPPPPNPLIPEYTLLAAEPAERMLAKAEGEYTTGVGEGHRGMEILRDGRLHWVRFGPKGELVEETDLTGKAAQARGKPALATSDGAVLEILDANTLLFYGNTYRRKAP